MPPTMAEELSDAEKTKRQTTGDKRKATATNDKSKRFKHTSTSNVEDNDDTGDSTKSPNDARDAQDEDHPPSDVIGNKEDEIIRHPSPISETSLDMAGEDRKGFESEDEIQESAKVQEQEGTMHKAGDDTSDVSIDVKENDGSVRQIRVPTQRKGRNNSKSESRRDAKVVKFVQDGERLKENTQRRMTPFAEVSLTARSNYRIQKGEQGADFGDRAKTEGASEDFIPCNRGSYNRTDKDGQVRYTKKRQKPDEDAECDCKVCKSRDDFDQTKMVDKSVLRSGRGRTGNRNFNGPGRRLGD